MEQSNHTSETNSAGMWKDLCRKVRKPCLTMDLDLQMQVYPDYDAAPSQSASDGKAAGNGAQSQGAICDKHETVTVKWRIADMVAVGMMASVAVSLLCCVKHMCGWMK